MDRLNPSFLWVGLTGFALYGGVRAFKYCKHPAEGSNKLHESGSPTPHVEGLGSSDKIDYAAAMTDEAVDAQLNEFAYSHTAGDASDSVEYFGAQLGSNEICEDAYLHGKFANPLKGGGDDDWLG